MCARRSSTKGTTFRSASSFQFGSSTELFKLEEEEEPFGALFPLDELEEVVGEGEGNSEEGASLASADLAAAEAPEVTSSLAAA